MGWEERKGRGRYYVRCYRAGGRLVREYIGTGPAAEIVAARDELERERRRLEREARAEELATERAQLEAALAPLTAFTKLTEVEMTETLAAAGFHRHHGEWRKRKKP